MEETFNFWLTPSQAFLNTKLMSRLMFMFSEKHHSVNILLAAKIMPSISNFPETSEILPRRFALKMSQIGRRITLQYDVN